ncbi:hypothetical protein ACI784_15225 [Geodermatophilus sp. SYSU D01186]
MDRTALLPFDAEVIVEIEDGPLTLQQHARFMADQMKAHEIALG